MSRFGSPNPFFDALAQREVDDRIALALRCSDFHQAEIRRRNADAGLTRVHVDVDPGDEDAGR